MPARAGRPPTPVRIVVLVIVAVGALVLVGVVVAGLVSSGVVTPDRDCGGEHACPEEESEAWFIGAAYALTWAVVALGAIVPTATVGVHRGRRAYVRGATALIVVSGLLGRWTPRTWVPLRPAFAAGALGMGGCLLLSRLLGPALRREAAAEAAWIDGLLAADRAAEGGPGGGPEGEPGEGAGHGPRDFGGGAGDN